MILKMAVHTAPRTHLTSRNCPPKPFPYWHHDDSTLLSLKSPEISTAISYFAQKKNISFTPSANGTAAVDSSSLLPRCATIRDGWTDSTWEKNGADEATAPCCDLGQMCLVYLGCLFKRYIYMYISLHYIYREYM